jgi:hypothetical protein
MAGSRAGSPEYRAERNDPDLDQRVSIAFILIDTFFLLVFFASRYFNPKAVGVPMVVCNTLCYVLCMGSAATGICESFPSCLFAWVVGFIEERFGDTNEVESIEHFPMLEEKGKKQPDMKLQWLQSRWRIFDQVNEWTLTLHK